jgi:glycosyltransferase involved in cell wall biosynthesis
MKQDILVSAVIPTRNRPRLVLRAVKSALEQTYPRVEVVVVVDGPDHETVQILEDLADARVRVIALAENVGGSEARNIGVRAARGEWIALLDDDDEWLPQKMTRQMAALGAVENKNVVLSCMYVEQSAEDSRVYPVRLPDPSETIDAYLCCPRGFRTGGELLQTSTLVVPKSLMIAVPFVFGLKRGQDFMWLIRAGGVGQAALHIVPEVLSVFNSGSFTDERRVSSRPNWRSFYSCVRDNRALFTRDAYAYCIATRILTVVIKCEEPFFVKAKLLGECLVKGSASIKCVLVFLYVWMIPPDARSWLGESLRVMTKWAGAGRSQVGAT